MSHHVFDLFHPETGDLQRIHRHLDRGTGLAPRQNWWCFGAICGGTHGNGPGLHWWGFHMGWNEVTSFHQAMKGAMLRSWLSLAGACWKMVGSHEKRYSSKPCFAAKTMFYFCVCFISWHILNKKSQVFAQTSVSVFFSPHFLEKGFSPCFPHKVPIFHRPPRPPTSWSRTWPRPCWRPPRRSLSQALQIRWENPWENHERTMERHISWNFPYVFSICIYNIWHIQHIYIYMSFW